jgi:hypothetical protein
LFDGTFCVSITNVIHKYITVTLYAPIILYLCGESFTYVEVEYN